MNDIVMNRIILLLALSLSVSCSSTETAQVTHYKKVQSCVLYGTNKNKGYPIPKQRCVEIPLGINCDEKVVDSGNRSKIWRSYPMLNCSDPNIKAGLSERYLLEGVD